jgi:hypothetical protein
MSPPQAPEKKNTVKEPVSYLLLNITHHIIISPFTLETSHPSHPLRPACNPCIHASDPCIHPCTHGRITQDHMHTSGWHMHGEWRRRYAQIADSGYSG